MYPLVSVIIPTYNRPTYLRRCLESVLNQTYKNIEIFVVDDNNPETEARIETEKIMNEYVNGKNVTYLKHNFNKNGSAARNTGWKHSSGKYITFLDDDYEIDEKQKSVALTESGIQKAEVYFNVENITDIAHMELYHHINQALKAHTNMKKDVDYVVKDGEIIIVDEFTGRLMFGRRYSEGLHQAIEAKEGLHVQRESKTLATITFQNFFRMYSKLAGMTGTAKTEEEEFKSIYKMDVVQIPTNKPILRQDLPDVVYKNERGKFNAVAEDILERHAKNQPVLVGTVSIEKSELLSQILKRKGVKHEVLNAKNHEKEAEIIAQAGRLGAVTIATNMAGRGTDIVLGGNPLFLTKKELKKHGFTDDSIKRVDTSIDAEELAENEDLAKAKETFEHLYDQFKEQAAKINHKKRILFEIAASPEIYSMGKDTYINEMIETIGAENVMAKETGAIKVSEEAAIMANPDVILTNVEYVPDPINDILKLKGWEEVKAVKNKAVYSIDNERSSLPNQHVIKAMTEMAKAVYPDVFKNFK